MSADRPPLTLPPLDERPGPARRISAAHAGRLVDGALAAPSARPAPRLARRAAFAATMLFALGGAASAAFVVGRTRAPALAPRPAPVPVPARPAPARAVTMDMMAPAAEAPPAPAAPVRATRSHAAQPSVPLDDRLRLANDLRGHGRWREAERAYRQVNDRSPRSDAGYAAAVAAAALRLEHLDDPRGARALYRAVLRDRPEGALAEEARWGLAEAERRLGDGTGEARALRGFLAHHPSALQRARAAARLDTLEP